MKNPQIKKYFNELEKKLIKKKPIHRNINEIKNLPLTLGQCLYLIDYRSSKIVYTKGIENLLGYSDKKFNLDLLLEIIHPDDLDTISKLIEATLTFASKNNVSLEAALNVSYRVKNKKGKYIKVLRQSSVFEHDANGKVISSLSILSDISFLNLHNQVLWKFEAPGLDQNKFRTYVSKAYVNFFSKREYQIIQYLVKGYTSKKISETLYISKHTVDTHRRKILSKSKCENTIELINFVNHNGLL